ncbi:MAG: heavy metal-responsive transcriptional regulator [Acidobacteriota bacterium]
MRMLLIGEVAARAGVAASTLRYYEAIGLIEAAPRSASGYRRFHEGVLDEIRFIRKGQALGFSLEELAEVLRLSREGRSPCMRVLDLAREHLAAVDERLRQMQRFRTRLASELSRWESQSSPVQCDGLCRLIDEADWPASPAPASRRPPPARMSGRHGSRGGAARPRGRA